MAFRTGTINIATYRQLSKGLGIRPFSTVIDPPGNEPEIPQYGRKENEPIDVKRARLLYQSRKRGILENDLILGTFADRFLKTFDLKLLHDYDQLINTARNDWDIYYWATGVKPVPAEYDNQVMALLKEHTTNPNREVRLRQPDLKQ